MKLKPDTVKVDINKPEDIYKLQEVLIQKGDDEIRVVAEEFASNMIEFHEKGFILANCETVHCFIDKSSIDNNASAYLKLAFYMKKEFEKEKNDAPIKVHKDQSDLGGYGLKRIKNHGWNCRLTQTNEHFIILAKNMKGKKK